MPLTSLEQTFAIIKPDALKNSLTGYVLSQLSEYHTGLHFAGMRVMPVTRLLAEEHYVEHKGKAFFPPLIDYIMGNAHYGKDDPMKRVIAIVYQGPDAVKKLRELAGPTNPEVARDEKPGCIRSLGANMQLHDEKGNLTGQRMDNLIHASATTEEAEREVKLWFRPSDIPFTLHAYPTAVCAEHFYYMDGTLSAEYAPGCICVMAPGKVAWQTDLETLQAVSAGKEGPATLNAVIAKYLD